MLRRLLELKAALILLLAPEIEDFIKDKKRSAGFRISDSAGGFLAGEPWIDSVLPATREPEFHSIEDNGIIYRSVVVVLPASMWAEMPILR